MEHKLKLQLCVTELKLMTRSHFIEMLMILTKYMLCKVRVWLTEYSVTVGYVTLRFYCSWVLGDCASVGGVCSDMVTVVGC